jgi:hypothetical protein
MIRCGLNTQKCHQPFDGLDQAEKGNGEGDLIDQKYPAF